MLKSLVTRREFNILNSNFFSFNSYDYYLTCGFLASTSAFNVVTHAFNLLTRPKSWI